jgi:hypothetical protein
VLKLAFYAEFALSLREKFALHHHDKL